MSKMRWSFLVLSGCLAAACAPEESADEAPQKESGVQRFEGRGTILFFEESRVFLNHDEIPGFMDAMSMGFDVRDPSVVEGFEPGTKVRFRVVMDDDGVYIDQMARETEE